MAWEESLEREAKEELGRGLWEERLECETRKERLECEMRKERLECEMRKERCSLRRGGICSLRRERSIWSLMSCFGNE